jgi:hypothetical protein
MLTRVGFLIFVLRGIPSIPAASPAGQDLPWDEQDLAACERMWRKLPHHRKTKAVREAMDNARAALQKKKTS